MNGRTPLATDRFRTLFYGVDGETSLNSGMTGSFDGNTTNNDWIFFTGDMEWFTVEGRDAGTGTTALTTGVVTIERTNEKRGAWYNLPTGTTIVGGGMSDRIESTSEWTRVRLTTLQSGTKWTFTVHGAIRAS